MSITRARRKLRGLPSRLPSASSTRRPALRTLRRGSRHMHGTHHSAADRDCGPEELNGGARVRRDGLPATLAAAPAQLASALSRSDAGSRQDVLARLQSAGGNLEVGRLLESAAPAGGDVRTVTETVRYPFQATIRKAPPS